MRTRLTVSQPSPNRNLIILAPLPTQIIRTAVTKSSTARQKYSGLFIVDLKSLSLSQKQMLAIDNAIQEAVQTELAKLDDTEGSSGGPISGIMGFVSS